MPVRGRAQVRPDHPVAAREARGLPPGASSRSTPRTGRCCSSPTRAGSGTRACGGCCSCCSRAPRSSPCATRRGRCSFTRTPTPRRCAGSGASRFPLLAPRHPARRAAGPRGRWSGCSARRSSRSTSCGSPGAERLLYFKHEERPVLVQPSKLVLGRTQPDELNRGRQAERRVHPARPAATRRWWSSGCSTRRAREDTPDEIRADAERVGSPRASPTARAARPRPRDRPPAQPSGPDTPSVDAGGRGSRRSDGPGKSDPPRGPRGGLRAARKGPKRGQGRRPGTSEAALECPLRDGPPPLRTCRQSQGGGNAPREYGRMGRRDHPALLVASFPGGAGVDAGRADRDRSVPRRGARRAPRGPVRVRVPGPQRSAPGLRPVPAAACARRPRPPRSRRRPSSAPTSTSAGTTSRKPFDLWVLAIARNLCLDLLRRRSSIHTQDVDEMHESLPSGERSQEEGAIAAEEHRSLEAALADARRRTTARCSPCITCRSAPRRRSRR